MKKDTEITEVEFYMEAGVGENAPETCLAAFTGINEGKGMFLCYSHVGQHSACENEYLNYQRAATPDEYKHLKSELESIGYNLKVIEATTGKYYKPFLAYLKK